MNAAAASAILQGGNLQLRPPISALRPYLGCFWSLTTTTDTRLRGLPDGCCMLWFERDLFLSGPQLVPSERIPDPGQVLVGVRLQPGVAFLLTGVAVHKFAGKRTRLARILQHDHCVPLLEKQLSATDRAEERFDLLQAFLMARLGGKLIDQRVATALQQIESSSGQIRIMPLAQNCHTSVRNLCRLLRCWVGLSPKRLARVVRFQAMLQHLELPRLDSPARIAAELGYFDQAHLSGEVARLSGISPGPLEKRYMADFSKTRCG
jgi:AraC-like DNA-binding protein